VYQLDSQTSSASETSKTVTSSHTTQTSLFSQAASASQTNETVGATSSFGLLNGTALGSDGLQLSASLNASQLTAGQTLQVNASVFNTLSNVNNVTVSDGWPFQGIPLAIWPDCDLMLLGSSTIGFNLSVGAEAVVLKGYYTINNITSVADIHFPVNGCTMGLGGVEQVTFEPNSSQANLTGNNGADQPNMTVGPYHIGSTFTTTGYWNLQNNSERARFPNPSLDYEGQQTPSSPTATPFAPGVYTVGIEDMWGQAVILHFTVT
jgi:hypothetical protein